MYYAGVDEVGRGTLAGPVVASAVILPTDFDLPGLADSKKVAPKKREKLAILIRQQAIGFAIAESSVEEIDTLNILQASLLAMQRAITQLKTKPDYVYVDGNQMPVIEYAGEAIIKGDNYHANIQAASILAKVYRDTLMCDYHTKYPAYGFNQHMGYGTPQHKKALTEHGVCSIHRKTFAPVRKMLMV